MGITVKNYFDEDGNLISSTSSAEEAPVVEEAPEEAPAKEAPKASTKKATPKVS